MKTTAREILLVIAVIAGGLICYHHEFSRYLVASQDHTYFNDDVAQQIFPLYALENKALFQNDYIANYYHSAFLPLGFRAIYALGSQFASIETISKLLPYFLWSAVLFCIGMSSYRLGGIALTSCAIFLALASEIFLARLSGGLPRSFGFPLMAIALLATLEDRVRWLAVLAPIAILLYPVCVVPILILLAILLYGRDILTLPVVRARMLLMGFALVLSAVAVLPQLTRSQQYGARITTHQEKEFPEAGKKGRYGISDRAPYRGFFEAIIPYATYTFWKSPPRPLGSKTPQRYALEMGGVLISVALVWLISCLRAYRLKRLKFTREQKVFLSYIGAAFLAHSLSRLFDPYLFLPERYLLYALPLILVIGVPYLIYLSLLNFGVTLRQAQLTLVSLFAVIFLLSGLRWEGTPGLNEYTATSKPLFNYIASLPEDSLIAGFPQGDVDLIPYLSKRSVLFSYETHQAFHRGYTLEMRRRANQFFAAYFGTDVTPLIKLRDEFGVTHLVLERHHFSGFPPKYFQPFQALIEVLWQNGEQRGFYLNQDLPAQFTDGDVSVIDLKTLTVLAQNQQRPKCSKACAG